MEEVDGFNIQGGKHKWWCIQRRRRRTEEEDRGHSEGLLHSDCFYLKL